MSRLLFSAVLGLGLATSGAAFAQYSTSTNIDNGSNASGATKQQSPQTTTKPDNAAVNGTMANNMSGGTGSSLNGTVKGSANGGGAAEANSAGGGAGASGGGSAN